MIDNLLITNNTQQAMISLASVESFSHCGLLKVRDFFTEDALQKVRKFVDEPGTTWSQFENQENMPRDRVSWHSDSIIEELHLVCDSLTDRINEMFPEPQKNFWGISLWRDRPGYHIDWHQDNTDIDVAIQIYLFSHGPAPGTDFSINGNVVSIPFDSNTGYISPNSAGSSLPHRTSFAVPMGTVRYSLYAVWSRFLKHAPNS